MINGLIVVHSLILTVLGSKLVTFVFRHRVIFNSRRKYRLKLVMVILSGAKQHLLPRKYGDQTSNPTLDLGIRSHE